MAAPRPDRPARPVRLLAAAALLCLAGTFLAAQIDFVRRHDYGISPVKYWLPQLTHVWLPGLSGALLLAGTAFALHRRNRPD